MLEVKNVSKKFNELLAVDDLSFKVSEGEIFALLGANGAGKTTTFRMIMGLLEPNNGEILLDGHHISYDDSYSIGFLIEERSLLTKLTVSELIIHYGRLKGLSEPYIKEKMSYWLNYFNLAGEEKRKIKELSKGNQQKVQFITSIINNPKLLILDEPFSGLDPFNMEKFIDVIRKLKDEGCAIIFSTHRIDHVEMFCENIVVLVKGKTVLKGNIDEIKDDFKRKTIRICADANIDELKKIDGVITAIKNANEFVLSVASKEIVENVFDYVKGTKNVTKFVVEKPTLSEIFIEKVGEEYNG